MKRDVQRRLRQKSDELLVEADRLDEIERTVDALPVGSDEIVEATQDAEGQAVRLRRVAHEDGVITRELVDTPDKD